LRRKSCCITWRSNNTVSDFEYFRQLLRSVLQDEATLRAMVEKAFERGLFVHVVSLPALVNDPTLLAWSVSSERYSENLLREVEAQPQEWYLVLSAHWSPSRLDLEIFHIPIHLTGLFPTYDWYQVLRFVEPDSVRDWLSSVLGEEAKKLMTRWQAEMEDALQSQFAQQVVEIEKPSESLLPQIVAWAQASGVEIILELLPSRDTRLVHTPRQFSLKQLLSAKTYDAPILLRLRVFRRSADSVQHGIVFRPVDGLPCCGSPPKICTRPAAARG
jgi:hypothetical protein